MAAENTRCTACAKSFNSGILVGGFCGWCRKICSICGARGARSKRGDETVCKGCKTKVLCLICRKNSNTNLCDACGSRTISFAAILDCKEPLLSMIASHLRQYCNMEGVADNASLAPQAPPASSAPQAVQVQLAPQVQSASSAPQAVQVQLAPQEQLESLGSKIISAIKNMLTSDGKEPIADAAVPAPEVKQKSGKNKALSIAVWDKQFGPDARIGKCYVCSRPIKMEDYEMGHIVSAHDGGSKTIDNLLPVCKNCNRSCGTQNLHAFKAKMGM